MGRSCAGHVLGARVTRLVAADQGALALAEQLLTILREGRYSSTYKYAVILGLMDLCLEKSTRTGAAPTSVSTPELAEKVIELYWPHSRPFRGGQVLKQNSGRQAGILQRIAELRGETSAVGGTSPTRARLASPDAWSRLICEVEWILVHMPLPKLQRVGSDLVPFVYQIQWDDGIRRQDFRSPDFDNLIRLVGRSGDHLIRLSGLLRPLVCREWATLVARLNRQVLDDPELDDFLFGAERSSLSRVKKPLHELQGGHCFYCEARLSADSHVDHFIPWARYPDNGLANLVVAHARCNGEKRDHLAAAGHVARWAQRPRTYVQNLEEISREAGWPVQRETTLAVARSIYLRLPGEARLWRIGDEFESADRDALVSAFDLA
jgi:5-methylcytosine-specific restriction endonuclease McrA